MVIELPGNSRPVHRAEDLLPLATNLLRLGRMTSFRYLVKLGLALCAGLLAQVASGQGCAPLEAPGIGTAAVTTASAQLLGGVAPAGPHGTGIAQRPFWLAHARAMDGLWQQGAGQRRAEMLAFSRRELALSARDGESVYYPFGGPDLVHAMALFPDARRYLLIGLEEPGTAPEWGALSEADAAVALAQLRGALRSVLPLGFFLTNDMRQDLKRGRITGVAPLLMATAARLGLAVMQVETIHVARDGSLCLGRGGTAGVSVDGARLLLRDTAGNEREVIYLQADLSDAGLGRAPQPIAFLERHPPSPVLLKAASYLLHQTQFGALRALLLEHASMVLQDDSGLPFGTYDPQRWEARLFGIYRGPISLFGHRDQPLLRAAYQQSGRPLSFGIGYHHQAGHGNLQWMRRRAAAR